MPKKFLCCYEQNCRCKCCRFKFHSPKSVEESVLNDQNQQFYTTRSNEPCPFTYFNLKTRKIRFLCRGTYEYTCKLNITRTYLYNFDPLKPHFYIVSIGVYTIFLISAQKHRLWVLVRTASPRRF